MKAWAGRGGDNGPPAIDARTMPDFIRQMKAMVPHYTPEWRFSPEDPDAGTALFFLAAEMLEENVNRLNQVPMNHFIAFLDRLGIRLQPARPARTYVVFKLNEGVRETVYVPSGTMLTAPAEDGGDDLPFETDSPLAVSPARLIDLLNVHPGRDRIVLAADRYEDALSADAAPAVPLFSVEGDNLQEHAFYIRHDELLLLDRPAVLTLRWHNAQKRYVEDDLAAVMGRSDALEWSYSRGAEWIPFEEISAKGNEVTLRKTTPGPSESGKVNGVEGRWIRCRVRSGHGRSPVLDSVPEMDRLTMRAVHDAERDDTGISPAELYFNDTELDGTGFHPFGPHFVPYSVFYAACPEALSKRGSRLRLNFRAKNVANSLRTGPDPEIRWKMIMRTADFEPKPAPKLYVRKVIWEYWNGDNWMRIPESGRYEGLFAELTEEASDCEVEFPCPDDLAPAFVNGREDRWLRVRVMMTDPVTAPVVDYMSPWLEGLRFSYAYNDTAALVPETAFVLNNAEMADVTAATRQGGAAFKPFLPIPAPAPSVYFGFDVPPVKGPIRLHFTLGRRIPADGNPPWVEWEAYVRGSGGWSWIPLKTLDETMGFTESGMLQFAGPPSLAPARLFGRERVWLRAVNRDGVYGAEGAATPVAEAVRRNAVPVVQRRTIRDEYPEKGKDGFRLSAAPVIGHEVWVDETGAFGEHELAALSERQLERYEIYRDSEGRVQRLWVRWEPVSAFSASGPDDRHYVLDSASGLILFGDGTRGRVPPQEGGDKIRVTYRVTEGARGNAGAMQITGLMQSIAFVGGVANPAPAAGGSGAEPIGDALRRGPNALKHRGRGISAADVEWVVRELEPGVLKVKCLPGRNARLETAPGHLTVAVLTPGEGGASAFFPETKRRLEEALRRRLPNVVGRTGRFGVIAPAFLEISVIATVVVDSPERMLPAEAECLRRLNRFLDPAAGRTDGNGWDIGEPVHVSVFYGLLQSVPGVKRVDKLHLGVVKAENGERTEIPEDRLREVLHGIVTSGAHRLMIETD
ncbi:baseplate J/gp47 family protein [Cohnella caldifontis]|uniref:baseplate J/gp47 family protein n=1 Tax=Cohnella caldifontis TaxID=3027471 RepID=UPI0023EBA0B5|nr:baseplate J/gp47 family protein [Cohnella sp. YIM B05605]